MADFDFVETDSSKIYTAIVGTLMDSVGEPLYPGDERRIFAEALVSVFVSLFADFNDKAKQRTLQYARGTVLDAIGERYVVYRADPAKASATFRFSVADVQAGNIIIAEGTRITTDGSAYFATSEASILPAGSNYVHVLGVCTEGGSKYNGLTPGTISTLVDLIPGIANVQNTTISTGGDNGEPYTEEGDARFRERIRLSPATLSTAGPENAYRYFALSADPDIIDVETICPVDSPCVVNVYPLMKGGAIPDSDTLAKVLGVLSASSVRPMTDKVTALAPAQVSYSINIKYYCYKESEAATIEVIEGSGGAIEQYIDWQSAKLGRDINPDELRRLVLAPASGYGAVRLEVVSPTFEELGKSQVAKLSGTPTITHELIT